MKELDLTEAKLLKLWLRMGYHDYQIRGEKDICSLTRMFLWSGVLGVSYLFMIGFMVAVGCASLWAGYLMFSFLTLYLPESYWASPDDMLVGMILTLIVSIIVYLGFLGEVLQGKRDFAPEYMKRPLRKLFKQGNNSSKENTLVQKKPSQTWIALKEMGKSWKEKTCIKVKL